MVEALLLDKVGHSGGVASQASAKVSLDFLAHGAEVSPVQNVVKLPEACEAKILKDLDGERVQYVWQLRVREGAEAPRTAKDEHGDASSVVARKSGDAEMDRWRQIQIDRFSF